MSKVQELLEELDELEQDSSDVFNARNGAGLVQYTSNANVSQAAQSTTPRLRPGVYTIENSMRGIQFVRNTISTDDLLRFPDKRQDTVIGEVKKFVTIRDNFKKLGLTHKGGTLLYGPPGSGKSTILKLVIEDVTKAGGVVFYCRSPSILVNGLREFREIEPDRIGVVVMEDIDGMMYQEQELLQLLDGDNQVDGVYYLATTNYLERLSPRMVRSGRLDRKILVPLPPKEGRMAYLQQKLGTNEETSVIEDLVEKTRDFSFGQLRNLLVGVYCYGYGVAETINRIRNGLEEGIPTVNERQVVRLLEKSFARRRLRSPASAQGARMDEGKSRAGRILDGVAPRHTAFATGVDTDAVQAEFQKKLDRLGIDGITVSDVVDNGDGNTSVYFTDNHGCEMSVLFTYSDAEGAQALIIDPDPSQFSIVVDLDSLAPAVSTIMGVKYINLQELSWLNKSTLLALFTAGDIEKDPESAIGSYDAYGNLILPVESKYVGMGGKSRRLPIVNTRKPLTPGLRLAVEKARNKRAPKANIKRAITLKIGAPKKKK